MRNNGFQYLLLSLALGFLCNFQTIAQTIQILDSAETGVYSTTDRIDHFFERIQPLDVSIQLKDPSISKQSQKKASQKLIEEMKRQGVTVDEEKQSLLRESMEQALELSNAFLKNYPLPDTLRLGVIKGALYGPGTFYTRENCIFIPDPMVSQGNQPGLIRTLIHEIFHIQSRYHPELQKRLYAKIGFREMEGPPNIPSALKKRTLLNPDGTDWNFYIPLAHEGDTAQVYTLIVSKKDQFQADQPTFFQYLDFQLYRLKVNSEGEKMVTFTSDLQGLPPQWMGAFMDQITNNTQYIIHPDEIAAENFVFLVQKRNGMLEIDPKPKGKQLLESLAAVYNLNFLEK